MKSYNLRCKHQDSSGTAADLIAAIANPLGGYLRLLAVATLKEKHVSCPHHYIRNILLELLIFWDLSTSSKVKSEYV
jgi:hypothetical protein